MFRDRVQEAIAAAERNGTAVAVMIMDLDRFKEINDTLGHHNGDELLCNVGPRLERAVRTSDTVARLGGDEFGLLVPNITDRSVAERIARRAVESLEAPFEIQGLNLEVEASIGAAFFPDQGTDVDTLLQRADVAMYTAKRGHSGYVEYATEHDAYSFTRLRLMTELRQAMDNDELVIHYQPKAALPTGKVTSVEALVRWQHPERGLIPPCDFIPAAENTGAIKTLTLDVIDKVLSQSYAWRNGGIRLKVSVNLSARCLLDVELPATIYQLLRKWEVPPSTLQLEVTESSIMADPPRVQTVLEKLRSLGIEIAIDDFGTGYFSLSNLKNLPVDEIKIDKLFVTRMAADHHDAAIVQSTIDLARNLNLRVVAEGVETKDVWERLSELGCDLAQGAYIGCPSEPDELLDLLAKRRVERIA